LRLTHQQSKGCTSFARKVVLVQKVIDLYRKSGSKEFWCWR
jgi:hypothetical protein